jgi:hypothetical protein
MRGRAEHNGRAAPRHQSARHRNRPMCPVGHGRPCRSLDRYLWRLLALRKSAALGHKRHGSFALPRAEETNSREESYGKARLKSRLVVPGFDGSVR